MLGKCVISISEHVEGLVTNSEACLCYLVQGLNDGKFGTRRSGRQRTALPLSDASKCLLQRDTVSPQRRRAHPRVCPADTHHIKSATPSPQKHQRPGVRVHDPLLLHAVPGVMVELYRSVTFGCDGRKECNHKARRALDVIRRCDASSPTGNEQRVQPHHAGFRKHDGAPVLCRI